jgi:hypothetical protein
VAQLARELVRQSINGLDSLALQKRLLKNKVKESAVLPGVERAYPVPDAVEFIPTGAENPAPSLVSIYVPSACSA